jgi:PilZ domain
MQRMQGWIGRKDRFPVAIEAVVHRSDGASVSVRLTDFSEEGCRMEGDDVLQIGERVSIDVPRLGLVKAQVRWALGGSAGMRFFTQAEA